MKAPELINMLRQLTGLVPFQPEMLLFDQATAQPEFMPGTEAYAVQEWIDDRKWDWRFVARVPNTDIMVLKRPVIRIPEDENEVIMCLVPPFARNQTR